jgi:hypothetical protein
MMQVMLVSQRKKSCVHRYVVTYVEIFYYLGILFYIMVKMETPDMPDGHGADVGVTLSEHNLEKYSEVIEDLHIGDHIAVNATLLSLGDKHHLHHLRAFNIAKIPGHMDVQAHAHSSGRYKLKLAHNETD